VLPHAVERACADFFVNFPGYALHATAARKAADGAFADTLDVLTQNFLLALRGISLGGAGALSLGHLEVV